MGEREIDMFMKKILTVILTITMVFAFTACGDNEGNIYIVPKEKCYSIFGCTAKSAVEDRTAFPWIEDNYISMEVDEDGNLVIVLSDMQVERWRTEVVNKFEEVNKRSSNYGEGIGFQVNETYTEIEYYINKKMYTVSGFQTGTLYPSCGIMQMLDGADLSNWHVDIKAIDIDSGITIKEARLPDEWSFIVEGSDWEKALGKEEWQRLKNQ